MVQRELDFGPLSKKTTGYIQKILKESGQDDCIPRDAIVIREPGKQANLRAHLLNYAYWPSTEDEPKYPHIEWSEEISPVYIKTYKNSPLATHFNLIAKETEPQTKTKHSSKLFILLQHPKASRRQYRKARNLFIKHANIVLVDVGVTPLPEYNEKRTI